MSENISNTPLNEANENLKKDQVTTYVRDEIERIKKKLESLGSVSHQPLSVPEQVRKDGGSDLRDWEVEVAQDAQLSDQERGQNAKFMLETQLFNLEGNIVEIEKGNNVLINRLWEEMTKSSEQPEEN